jgi:YesN/AraC family two-component response regulator
MRAPRSVPRVVTDERQLAAQEKQQRTAQQQTQQQEAAHEERRIFPELTVENIQDFFLTFLAQQQDTLTDSLKHREWELTQEHALLPLASSIEETSFRRYKERIEKQMRKNFGIPELVVDCYVSSELREAVTLKPRSAAEKLAELYKENPALQDLAERLGLQPE